MPLFAASTIAQARERTARLPWAGAVLAAIRARADAWLAQPGQIPAQAGGWIHDYVCPQHWSPLVFAPDAPAAHRCPAGETVSGPQYDAAWRVLRHRQIATTARALALVYAISGAPGYAAAAIQILEGYARRYAHFEGASAARPWMLKGHAFQQALTEALWAVPLAQAYDLVRPALDVAQDAQLVSGLLRPIATTLQAAQETLVVEQGRLRSNYNAWLISALGCLGFALDDPALIERALDGRTGLRAHLAAAILADGFEYEGSPYYHNFVSLAYTILAESALANGIDLYAERGPQGQSIEATWRALAALALPDGSFPAANDGTYWAGGPFDAEVCEVYEVALARTAAPRFAWLLAQAYARRASPRDQWTALLVAQQDLAGALMPRHPSVCLESIGMAVLRDESGIQAQAVCAPFGPHGGSHGHLDRLALQVWPWSNDPGTPPYGVPERVSWYQQTAAHNGIIVDGRSQQPCRGRLLSWHPTPTGGTLWLAADEAYPGVRFSRLITLDHDGLTDLITLDSDTDHTFDWIMHADGELHCDEADLQAATGALIGDGAYQFITPIAGGRAAGPFSITVRHSGRNYRLMLAADVPLDIMLAYGPGSANGVPGRRAMLIARAHGHAVRFLMRSEGVTDA